MEPIEWIMAIAAIVASVGSAISSGVSAKKDREADNERIAQQNVYNREQYELEKQDNSIMSQAAQAKEAGYNLNYFSPSFVPTSGTAQQAGTDSKAANVGNLLKTFSGALSGVSSGAMSALTSYQSAKTRQLNKEYHDAQIEALKQQIDELKATNAVKRKYMQQVTLLKGKEANWYDILAGDRHNLNFLNGNLLQQTYNFNQATAQDRIKIIAAKRSIAESNKVLADLESKYQKNYHSKIFDDAYWQNLKDEMAWLHDISGWEHTKYQDYMQQIYAHDLNAAKYLAEAKSVDSQHYLNDWRWRRAGNRIQTLLGSIEHGLGILNQGTNLGYNYYNYKGRQRRYQYYGY